MGGELEPPTSSRAGPKPVTVPEIRGKGWKREGRREGQGLKCTTSPRKSTKQEQEAQQEQQQAIQQGDQQRGMQTLVRGTAQRVDYPGYCIPAGYPGYPWTLMGSWGLPSGKPGMLEGDYDVLGRYLVAGTGRDRSIERYQLVSLRPRAYGRVLDDTETVPWYESPLTTGSTVQLRSPTLLPANGWLDDDGRLVDERGSRTPFAQRPPLRWTAWGRDPLVWSGVWSLSLGSRVVLSTEYGHYLPYRT